MLSFCCLLRFFWGFFCRRCCCLIYFWKRNLMMRLRYTLHTRGRSHKYLPAEQLQQHLKHYWTRTSKIVERDRGRWEERRRHFQFADASATICLISRAVPAVQPVNADQICVFYLSIFCGIFYLFFFFFWWRVCKGFNEPGCDFLASDQLEMNLILIQGLIWIRKLFSSSLETIS